MTVALLALALQVQQTRIDVQPIVRGRLNASAHALWAPATGKPLVVVPYAFTADGTIRPGDSIPVKLALRVRDGRRDRGTTRSEFLTKASPRSVGYLVLTDVPRPGNWQLKADLPHRHEDDARQGRVTPLDTAILAISDVVLGDSALATSMSLTGTEVLLAPHETVAASSPVAMFFQVKNRGEYREGHLELHILRRIGRDSLQGEGLDLRTPLVLQTGINAIQRVLDLSRLVGSEYDIVVTMLDEQGRVAAQRVTTVYLRQRTKD